MKKISCCWAKIIIRFPLWLQCCCYYDTLYCIVGNVWYSAYGSYVETERRGTKATQQQNNVFSVTTRWLSSLSCIVHLHNCWTFVFWSSNVRQRLSKYLRLHHAAMPYSITIALGCKDCNHDVAFAEEHSRIGSNRTRTFSR